jgi:hypothetical protein
VSERHSENMIPQVIVLVAWPVNTGVRPQSQGVRSRRLWAIERVRCDNRVQLAHEASVVGAVAKPGERRPKAVDVELAEAEQVCRSGAAVA